MKMGRDKTPSPALEIIDFEAANHVPEITNLKECKKQFIEGTINVWYEYVPKSYHGQAVPLVVQIHGGGHDGKRWANFTIWHELAEREGMIVIYPNSPEYGLWSCEDSDVQYIYDLIQHICKKYTIDKERIYMQGMSNGDMMTLAFSMKHPEILAAAGYITGPSATEFLDGDRPKGALPIIQMRGELDINWKLTSDTIDIYENRYAMNDLNFEIWENVNGIENVIPAVCIEGKDNYLYYHGKNAPVIEWEIQGMGHREPVYSAQVLWDRLYKNCQRNGQVENVLKEQKADEDIVIIAGGSNQVYSRGQIIEVNPLSAGKTRIMLPAKVSHFCSVQLNEMCETEVMCVPAEFFEKIFEARLEFNDSGDKVTILFPDKTTVKLMADSFLMDVNGKYMALQKPCILRCGVFYIPVAEFCQMILKKQISVADDVMCISDHYAVLGRYTARILRKLLGGVMRPRQKEER